MLCEMLCPYCRAILTHNSSNQQHICTSQPEWESAKSRLLPKKSQKMSHNTSHILYPLSDSGWVTLTLVLILTFTLCPQSTMSNPLPAQDDEQAGPSTSSHSRSRRAQDIAKWINPCRIPSSIPSVHMQMDVGELMTIPDTEIYSNIISQASKALLHAESFIRNYYEETFGEDLTVHDKFAEVHYDFLKEINDLVPKELGAELTTEQLKEIQVAELLRKMYMGLQMFAVGLEQVVLDQSVYGGSFHKDFQEAEYELKYVLCELQIAMLEKNIHHKDVTREIMSGEYRDIDCDTIRNIRDWVIFRDYVNTLEYMKQAFEYLMVTSS